MILYAVRWEEKGNEGFTRSEFVKPEEAILKAKELENEGKASVNIKLVETKSGIFVGELDFNKKTNRELLKEIGYDEQLLATMSDEDCEAEIQEIPYNL